MAYERKLTPLLATSKTRILTILIPLVLLVLTIGLVSPRLGFLMMPATDNEYLSIALTARAGTHTSELLRKVQEVDELLGKLPELKNYTMKLKDHQANILLRIVPRKERSRDSFAVERDLEQQLAFLQERGILVETSILQDGPPASAEV